MWLGQRVAAGMGEWRGDLEKREEVLFKELLGPWEWECMCKES